MGIWRLPFDGSLKPYEEGQQFGQTAYPRGRGYFHDGYDFGSAKYAGDFKAVNDGVVIYAGYYGGSVGTAIVLQIGDYQVMYQEFGSTIFVKTGDKVTVGQALGTLTSSHLHLGITKKNWQYALASWDIDDGTWLNPITILTSGDSYPSNPSKKFKVGEKVSFSNIATNWVGGKIISYEDMLRGYVVSKLNDDGTIYIRTLDDSWGGNVFEQDLMLSPTNAIETNDIIKLSEKATNWANGKEIILENKTARLFVVKEREGNKLLVYSDGGTGWQEWAFDWDCILERKHKISPVVDTSQQHVVMSKNSMRWEAYKGVSNDVKISLSEYDSIYKIELKKAETTKITSVSDPSVFGWMYNNEINPAPNNLLGRGDRVYLKESATNWADGKKIEIENKLTRTFLIKDRDGNKVLLYTTAGWQEWTYDWDVKSV